jgi:peptide-methionine (S)-S-oxide reductase
MKAFLFLTAFFFGSLLSSCDQLSDNTYSETEAIAPVQVAEAELDTTLEKAYFASGCFWCVEAVYESVAGVEEAISGYAGGTQKNPTYEQVGRGQTDHAESVEVLYDPEKVSFKTLVAVYYASQNPTTVNGQEPDFGKQYRSIIFYQNETEKGIAQAYKDSLDASGTYEDPIATEIVPLTTFWKAEAYHQDYERNNPDNPYVRKVSIPRLNRFKAKMPQVLK